MRTRSSHPPTAVARPAPARRPPATASTNHSGPPWRSPASAPPASTATAPASAATTPRTMAVIRRPSARVSHRPDRARQLDSWLPSVLQPVAKDRSYEPSSRVGPDVNICENTACWSGAAGAPATRVSRVPSRSSSSTTPSMAAWMSQATLCSGRTSSRRMMPPCAGLRPDGGANSIVVICSSSEASTRSSAAPAGGAAVAQVSGSGVSRAGAATPPGVPSGGSPLTVAPGTGGGGGIEGPVGPVGHGSVPPSGGPPKAASAAPPEYTVSLSGAAHQRGGRDGGQGHGPGGGAGRRQRAGGVVVGAAARRVGRRGGGREGCALGSLDRHALVGVEVVDGGHDVAGLDLSDVARLLRTGGAEDAQRRLELERRDQVDLDVAHADGPPGAHRLPVDRLPDAHAGQHVVDAVAVLAGDRLVRVADPDVRPGRGRAVVARVRDLADLDLVGRVGRRHGDRRGGVEARHPAEDTVLLVQPEVVVDDFGDLGRAVVGHHGRGPVATDLLLLAGHERRPEGDGTDGERAAGEHADVDLASPARLHDRRRYRRPHPLMTSPGRTRFNYALHLRGDVLRPDVPGAAGAGGGGGRLRLVLGARQPHLPGRLRRPLPLHGRRRPRVPRGQADHRALRSHPVAGGRDRAHPVHDVRAEGAGPPRGAAGQAGGQRRRADRQPAPARRRHQPVARGLRGDGPAVGAARRPPRRDDRRRAGPDRGRLVRAPRRPASTSSA